MKFVLMTITLAYLHWNVFKKISGNPFSYVPPKSSTAFNTLTVNVKNNTRHLEHLWKFQIFYFWVILYLKVIKLKKKSSK